jgi:hypothetical protein
LPTPEKSDSDEDSEAPRSRSQSQAVSPKLTDGHDGSGSGDTSDSSDDDMLSRPFKILRGIDHTSTDIPKTPLRVWNISGDVHATSRTPNNGGGISSMSQVEKMKLVSDEHVKQMTDRCKKGSECVQSTFLPPSTLL